jgi:hypothetical protein
VPTVANAAGGILYSRNKHIEVPSFILTGAPFFFNDLAGFTVLKRSAEAVFETAFDWDQFRKSQSTHRAIDPIRAWREAEV